MTRTSEVDEGPVTRVFKHIQQLVPGTTFHTLSRVESFMGDFLIDRTLEFYEEKNTEYQQSIKSKLGLANELPVFEK